MAGGLECERNLNVTARMLLNGENDLFVASDFNEYAWQKSTLDNFRVEPHDDL
jgi:hypothetical protein